MTVLEVERIGEAQFPAADAKQAMREYRRAMLQETNPRIRAELAALWRANRARAKGAEILDLFEVLKQTGLQPTTAMFPRLAICRANAEWCHVKMTDQGGAIFGPRQLSWNSRTSREFEVLAPTDTFARINRAWTAGKPLYEGKAMVPMVPPAGRPAGGLAPYYILWDAVWEPAPPRDPFLLKHLGGALYTVVFHWNLSPLEQAVMRGRLR